MDSIFNDILRIKLTIYQFFTGIRQRIINIELKKPLKFQKTVFTYLGKYFFTSVQFVARTEVEVKKIDFSMLHSESQK